MLLDGFCTTVTVAFVLADTSASDELWMLAEVSLRAEVPVLTDSGFDGGVSIAGPTEETLVSGDVCSRVTSVLLITKVDTFSEGS